MSDLVERCHAYVGEDITTRADKLLKEAADEIERLRERVEELESELMCKNHMLDNANEAWREAQARIEELEAENKDLRNVGKSIIDHWFDHNALVKDIDTLALLLFGAPHPKALAACED